MRVQISDSAIEDLRDIKEYYLALGVPKIGEDFIDAIFAHLDDLTAHPDIGRVVPEFAENHIRELIHPPFRIVYLRGITSIQVIRVWRSERLLQLIEDGTE